MLGRRQHNHDHANVRGAESKTARGRVPDVDKARLLYTMGSSPGGNVSGNPDNKGRQKYGLLGILAAISGIIGGVIATLEFAESGGAARTAGPILTAFTNLVVAIGTAFGHLARGTSDISPLVAAGALLFASVLLRLLAERLRLFITVQMKVAGQDGIPILLLEYTLTNLLFLPFAAIWVAAFAAVVPPVQLAAFGIAYVAVMAIASAMSAQVPQSRATRFRLVVGQLISILAAIGTTIALGTQGLSSAAAPVHNPWVAAITVLIATIAVRFLLEEWGLFATPRVRLGGVIYGWLILLPLPVLWFVAFFAAVPIWASAVFAAAYLVTVVLATAQSIYILFLVPPSSNDRSGGNHMR